jgi:CRP-like cAMP-binding protein
MSDLDTLARVPVFSGLSEPQLRAVLEVVRPQRVPQGTVIIQEGKSGDSLFILTRGSVEVTKRLGLASVTLASEKEKTIVRLDAPQFFGEMGLLENAERSATVMALGGCDLLEIIRLDFERLPCRPEHRRHPFVAAAAHRPGPGQTHDGP